MWSTKKIEFDKRTIKFKIIENGSPISFKQWSLLISQSTEFIKYYIDLLRSSEFHSFFWEVKPVNKNFWETEFEFVLVNSKRLLAIQADSSAFQEHFKGNDRVVSFPNLRGDAQLIVPNEIQDSQYYGHLADFVRKAPEKQVIEFWAKVGMEYQKRLGQNTIWLSTAGLGVPWLHARIDSTPKYYRHSAYKTLTNGND